MNRDYALTLIVILLALLLVSTEQGQRVGETIQHSLTEEGVVTDVN